MKRGTYKRTKKHLEQLKKQGFQKGAMSGKNNPFYAKHHTKVNRKKSSLLAIKLIKEGKLKPFSKGHKINIGRPSWNKNLPPEKQPNWIEDRSLFVYSDDWTDTLRESIRQRDNYVCQECGLHQDELKGFNKKLDIHHIDYDKDNCNLDNLITLCRKCHIKTNYNREYWKQYFDIKKVVK